MRRLLLTYKNEIIVPDVPEIPIDNNKIYYTSTNDSTVTPYSTSAFNTTISSNSKDSSTGKFIYEFADEVTTVGENAFRSRSTLQTIQLPNTVTSIGSRAFYYCSGLTEIDCGSGLETIAASAFSTCDSLTTVRLGNSITSVGQYAFYGCSNLTSVYCGSTVPPTGAYSMFESVGETCKIYVPMDSVDAYKAAKYWSGYADMITGYQF